jgi:alkyldihydroxyacetonephosphate synthase
VTEGVNEQATKWWGWGEEGRRLALPESALAMLRSELGETPASKRVSLEAVALPEPRLIPETVARSAGPRGVLQGHEQRLHRAAGRSYPDLVRLREGRLEHAPDGIVLPGDDEQVTAVIQACASAGVAVVPFGGGTSVVGGVEPLRGPHTAVLCLDLRRLRALTVDPVSMTATMGAGLRGPEAEAGLAAHGFTLGHFPQSFEQASIGGFAATRSAGQASSGYGRFDEMVTSLRMMTPVGPLETREVPHTAAGPALRELMLGSEGALGVITSVTARVRRAPAERRYEGFMVADFETGVEAFRELAQRDALPDVTRLSDPEETRISMGLSGASPGTRRALSGYLRLRRRAGGCLVIAGWEGERESVERRRAFSSRVLRGAGAVSVGARVGEAWERGRYDGPYLRDELMDLGYLVETLETAHTWTRLRDLYAAVGDALRAALSSGGATPIVMCHVSHTYRDGASLYFTFIAPARQGEEIEQWRSAKQAACDAIVAAGGTITHHHAVGTDHAPYMAAEVGPLGIAALRALKERLDPTGVMNPGKLLP